jgi:hypothetical protein
MLVNGNVAYMPCYYYGFKKKKKITYITIRTFKYIYVYILMTIFITQLTYNIYILFTIYITLDMLLHNDLLYYSLQEGTKAAALTKERGHDFSI